MLKVSVVLSFLFLPPSPNARAEDDFFDSAGVRLHYTVAGRGEPVLLLHGFALDSQMQWAIPGIMKELAQDHRVIALDSRGHGRSARPHDSKQYGSAMVDDAVRLLDHLHIDKAHVVGYSMGGFLALKMAAMHPARLLSVTSGGAGWSEKTDRAFLDSLAKSLEQGKGLGPLIRELTPADRPKPTDEQLKFFNRVAGAFIDSRALAALVRSHEGIELSERELKSIREPVLAIVGLFDPFKAGVDALQGRIPDLRVVVIPRADHMNAFRQPEFIRSLKEFLDQHKTSAGK
jgi:pimeloyl-ACP methyl ester carboxylesterase